MNTDVSNQLEHADIILECADLQSAQESYVREYGFRLELIFPADSPRCVLLGGHGIHLRLDQVDAAPRQMPPCLPNVIIQKREEHAWGQGRAGMLYRDLIPNRFGGKYIASHIRIPVGGPVPDYVHHHHIQFQLIYCCKGWVRVVYEDQGPPITMHAGDCVLQPPHIRHQVLECSDGMEVVEIACPAEHETLVEHEILLPTDRLDVERDFDGQTFVFHEADKTSWAAARLAGFSARDTGIAAATKGVVSAMVLRPAPGTATTVFTNDDEFCFNFILGGSLTLLTDDDEQFNLNPGDVFVVPTASSISMNGISPDLELLQVTSGG